MILTTYKPALLKCLPDLGLLYSRQILSYTQITGQLRDAGITVCWGLGKYVGDVISKHSFSPHFQVYNNASLMSQDNEIYSGVIVNPKL